MKGQTHGGKGSTARPTSQSFYDNFDAIFKKKKEPEVTNVFKEYMQGGLTPEIQALLKAQVDIKQGLFSIKQAANFYDVEIMDIINFITESQEYDEYSRNYKR
jgi:hypothetical protein